MPTPTDSYHAVRFPLGRAERNIHPNLNVHFDQGNLVVEASLPGLELSDLYLHLSRTRLNLHGERNGNFSRSLELPAEVDPTRMTSQLRNGVLQITVPVVREKEPRVDLERLPRIEGF